MGVGGGGGYYEPFAKQSGSGEKHKKAGLHYCTESQMYGPLNSINANQCSLETAFF
jgi:hypothetical protein